jgi:nucleotide-binding universal stress UspA family protein
MAEKVLLVTLDGSTFAEAPLAYAEAIAKATRCKLRLLTVVETSIEGVPVQPDALSTRLATTGFENANRYLKQLSGEVQNRGLDVETEIAFGTPATAILERAPREDSGLILMATHGRGGISRWRLGSVADKVMRLAPCPTLLVRPPEAGKAIGGVHFQHLLVPLDGSRLAERALEPATDLALATGAKLTLVRVVPFLSATMNWGGEYVPELGEIEAEMEADAKRDLEVVHARLPAAVDADTVVVRGTPALVLESYITEHPIDLTVMTTHGRAGFSRFVLGSTAERLVQAGVPMLLVHGLADQSGESVDDVVTGEQRTSSR